MVLPFGIIPGGATQTSFKALILASVHPKVKIEQLRVRTGERKRLPPTPARPSDKVKRILQAESVQAYRLDAHGLAPGEAYEFSIDAGSGRKHELCVRTLPAKLPADGITIAVGSCYYGGYGKDRHLSAALRSMRLGQTASLQIWSGDNLYLDVPTFSRDTASYRQTVDRYLEYFLRSEYWRARALCPNYTTYDDHDFWNNYPEHSLWLERDDDDQRADYVAAANDCLELFQASLNPPRVAGQNPGNSFVFEIDPLSVFVADVRGNRELNEGGRGSTMTKADLSALSGWAAGLTGPGMLVLGQPLWIERGSKLTDFNGPAYADYRTIWQGLRDAPFDVLVVSGDVHHSRVLRLTTGGRHVYELVSSPACHIPTSLSTVLPFLDRQGQAEIDPPTRDPGTGQDVSPRYFFGTDARHTIGMLWLRPDARRNVRVGAGFVDYTDAPRWAASAAPATKLPGFARRHETCVDRDLFTLKDRAEYI